MIPAYKARFLGELLGSLARQTNKNFSVIVADDGSPEDIAGICDRYGDSLDLSYVRFEINVGRHDLIAHWNRAVALSSAEWIMLPGDDDYLAEDAIEQFYNVARVTGSAFDVYRFSVRKVNAKSFVTESFDHASEPISAFDFLMSHQPPFPVQMVFARKAFERCGGFASFGLGWYSDNASWALFAAKTGIAAIPGGHVYWRSSGGNISFFDPSTEPIKFAALRQFVRWLHDNAPALNFSDPQIKRLVCDLVWRLYVNRDLELWQGIGFMNWFTRAIRTSVELGRFSDLTAPHHFFRFARVQVMTCVRRFARKSR